VTALCANTMIRAFMRNSSWASSASSMADETVVIEINDAGGGQVEAHVDSLPFAPGSLNRIQISLEALLAYDERRQDEVVAHLLTLLVPDGQLELVRKGPEDLMARWPGSLRVVDDERMSS
jgi:hypothetical protein